MIQSLLELRHLKTLVALAETGNLSRAADRLFLTQSALSHQLRTLEQFYETLLVDRDARPLRLTPAGQRLLDLARETLPRVAEAERDLARLAQGLGGPLRVAVECHTCFDWLMPAMDTFREAWPEVELDLVSGFHKEPLRLIRRGEAELAILHDPPPQQDGIAVHPLFGYETVALLAPRHPLNAREFLRARDFAEEVLISYPVADEMLDVMKHLLIPAGVQPQRRKVELTVAILQLVASGRGIAALPLWSVAPYVERGYVGWKHIGRKGLWCELHAATTPAVAAQAYIREFLRIIREQGLGRLQGVRALR